MATNPRSALDRLIVALEAFHAAASSAQDPDAPTVTAAADVLADAYTLYDDALFTQYGVEAPLDVYGEGDDFDEDFDEDDLDEDDLDEDDLDEDDLDDEDIDFFDEDDDED